ncbi:MAG: DUF401 family protein [Desulfobacterales bacterium]|nr:DUF401 family protein [Desulfobacterales bacterium]
MSSVYLPAFPRLLIVFLIIIIAIRKHLQLGHVFLLGACCLGSFFFLSPWAILKIALASLIKPSTVALLFIVSFILIFSQSLEQSGQMKRLLDQFQGVVKYPFLNLILFPAIIGLLPMPGGAFFSAPMVYNLGVKRNFTSTELSYINYWFRHIWEYWWPLYPGILLTITIGGINLWRYAFHLLPFTLLAIIIGYGFLYKKLNTQHLSEPVNSKDTFKDFMISILPILMVIVLGLGFGLLFSSEKFLNHSIGNELGLILSLIIGLSWIWIANRIQVTEIVSMFISRHHYTMIYMIAAVFIFKGILEQTHAIDQINKELIQFHIPLMFITILLPFMVGMMTGITVAFVGTTFPIIVGMIHSLGQDPLILSYLMLGSVSGFMGVLLSPLHLCLVMSNEYFKTTLGKIYPYLWISCGIIFVVCTTYFYVLRLFLGDLSRF